jgi:hypothetical protein
LDHIVVVASEHGSAGHTVAKFVVDIAADMVVDIVAEVFAETGADNRDSGKQWRHVGNLHTVAEVAHGPPY